MRTQERDKTIARLGIMMHLIGVASLLAGGVGFHFVVSSLVAQRSRNNLMETLSLEKLLRSAGSAREKHKQRTEELAALERDAENMRLRIPDLPQETEFLRQVDAAAKDEDLKIVTWKRNGWREKNTHSEYEIELVCEGNYPAICGFLDRMGHLSRVTTVQKLSIVTANSDGVYPFTMTLLLYYGARTNNPSNS